MRTSVYYNLHRHLWSIRAEDGPMRGRVIAHARSVRLDDTTCHVGTAGRDKTRATGHKQVHAYVRGELSAVDGAELTPAAAEAGIALPTISAEKMSVIITSRSVRFAYDPRTEDGFNTRYDETPQIITGGRVAMFILEDAFMMNPVYEGEQVLETA